MLGVLYKCVNDFRQKKENKGKRTLSQSYPAGMDASQMYL